MDVERPAKRVKVERNVILSDEQNSILKLVEDGYNVFYTGSAGTGKTILLKEIINRLRKTYEFDRIGITASTGLAACNIGGTTLHSFAGIGIGSGTIETLINKVKRSKKHRLRWLDLKVLVIDEISMIEGDLLCKLDQIAQSIRKSKLPFGGIQVIFVGDFFQLPPVTKNGNVTNYAFDSETWKKSVDVSINLQTVYRQKGDIKFIEMLNSFRTGKIDFQTEIEFARLARPLPVDGIEPAELYCTRVEVNKANFSRLSGLSTELHNFNAIDGGHLKDEEMRNKLLQNFMAPKELLLKVGAQVMMIKNIDETLVNGSLGRVVAFITHDSYIFFESILNNHEDMTVAELQEYEQNLGLLAERFESEKEHNSNDNARQKLLKEQFCKESTLGKLPNQEKDTSTDELFNALRSVSRNKTYDETKIALQRKLFDALQRNTKGQKMLPLVDFKTSNLSNRLVLVEPEDWAIEDDKDKALVSRVQLPLILAWAISIHKSQGQTLPKVKVDLKKVFEKGQAYVALSRAVSRDGLQVLNFDKSKIKVHDEAIKFYANLQTAEEAINAHTDKKLSSAPQYAPQRSVSKLPQFRSPYVIKEKSPPKNSGGIIAMLQKRSSAKIVKQK